MTGLWVRVGVLATLVAAVGYLWIDGRAAHVAAADWRQRFRALELNYNTLSSDHERAQRDAVDAARALDAARERHTRLARRLEEEARRHVPSPDVCMFGPDWTELYNQAARGPAAAGP